MFHTTDERVLEAMFNVDFDKYTVSKLEPGRTSVCGQKSLKELN